MSPVTVLAPYPFSANTTNCFCIASLTGTVNVITLLMISNGITFESMKGASGLLAVPTTRDLQHRAYVQLKPGIENLLLLESDIATVKPTGPVYPATILVVSGLQSTT